MPRTEALVKSLLEGDFMRDCCITIGNKDGEFYRHLNSTRGDVLTGKTYFDMMSVTKILAVSPIFHIAMEEGKISPDDTLGMYIPESPEDKKDIPLWMLLAHCSGIGRWFFDGWYGPERRADAIEFMLRRPLLYTPGSKYDYSCANFVLLGIILERIYNKPLNLLFDDMIARPLGMKNSKYLCEEDVDLVRTTRLGYDGSNKCGDPLCRKLYGVAGNAGIFSNLDDMTIFGQSLLSKHNKLMKEETFDIAAKDYNPTLELGRGLGYVHVDERYSQRGTLLSNGSIGHTGWSGTSLFADYNKGIYVCMLTNMQYCSFLNNRPFSETAASVRSQLHTAIAEDLTALEII